MIEIDKILVVKKYSTIMSEIIEEPIKKERYLWIDIGRGFVVFYMVFAMFIKNQWVDGNALGEFLVTHRSPKFATMNLYDIGAPAFIFIMGLLYGYTYTKRVEKGKKK